MRDPIKIIHKFKNNNKRIQYKVFIFIGSLLSDEIIKILKIIENKDFFNSLLILNNKQIKIIEEYYGIYWYQKLFISHHLKSQIKQIESNNAKKKQIITKLGEDWYKFHINIGIFKKISYSFASLYYDNLLDKKKNIIGNKKPEMDFRTTNSNSLINDTFIEDNTFIENESDNMIGDYDNESNNMIGGYEDDDDELIDLTNDDEQVVKKEKKKDKNDGDDEEPELNEEEFERYFLEETAQFYRIESLQILSEHTCLGE